VHAAFHCPAREGHPKQDSELNLDSLFAYGHDKPILPGATFSFALQPWAIDCPGGVDTIILSDGPNEGP
jgi:hypothetical protein